VTDLVVVDGRWRGHDGVERRPITVGRPDLKPIFRPDAEGLRVGDKWLDPHRRRGRTHRQQLRVESVEEELQRSQALLPIDDRAFLHQPGLIGELLQHDRPQEVRIVRSLAPSQMAVGDSYDVVPERLPLVLLIPDVRPVEKRNDEPLGKHEDHLRRPDLRLHLLYSLPSKANAQVVTRETL
jgi:hypothetical protein